MSSLLQTTSLRVTTSHSPVGFHLEDGWDRYLTLDGQRAFHLGNVCETCAFLFERMEGATRPVALGALTDRLAAGVAQFDEPLIRNLAPLLPVSAYRVALLRFTPEPADPGSGADYFANEQVDNEGKLDRFWGLPHYPRVPYYRPRRRSLVAVPDSDGARAFDFLVPMVPESWLKGDRLEHYAACLAAGLEPTAVALTVLDVKGPAENGVDHWCMAHYLLDGHHKLAAAARLGRPLTLLAFIALDHGRSQPWQVERVLATY